MSKLIVIEGTDGCGKGTQSKLLRDRLEKENYNLHNLSFPVYSDESSVFIRQYLNGDYGMNPEDVSAKQASLFYAMDRFHAFKANGQTKLAAADQNTVLLANRYTTSNILYQGAKTKTKDELFELIDWICELEYGILQIPEPDIILMPYIDYDKNMEMMRKRDIAQNARNNNMSRDIHEQNAEYLRHVSETSLIVAERMGFEIIDCMMPTGEVRTIEDIHEEIYERTNQKVLKYVNKKQ